MPLHPTVCRQLGVMSCAAEALGRRACHVTSMEKVNSHLVDCELEAVVTRLSKKHADFDFLLAKHEVSWLLWNWEKISDNGIIFTFCRRHPGVF